MAAQGSEAAAPAADEAPDLELCVACSEAPRAVLFTACGHRSLCVPCFSTMANMPLDPDRPAACPLCRVPVVGAGFKRTRDGEPLPSFEAAAVEPAQVARVEHFRRTGASEELSGPHRLSHPTPQPAAPLHAGQLTVDVTRDRGEQLYGITLSEVPADAWHVSANGIATLERLRRSDPGLKTLELPRARVGLAGAAALAEALLQNTEVETADLHYNEFPDAAFALFAPVFARNRTLRCVDFYFNHQIGEPGSSPGIVQLAEALHGNETLTALSLGHCIVGDDGAVALAGALRVNHTLLKLNLENCRIGALGLRALLEAARVNSTLQELDIQSPRRSGNLRQLMEDFLDENMGLHIRAGLHVTFRTLVSRHCAAANAAAVQLIAAARAEEARAAERTHEE